MEKMLGLKLSEDLVLVVLTTSVAVNLGFLVFMWKRSSDWSNEASTVVVLKTVPLKDEDEDLDFDPDKDKVTVFFGTQTGTAEGFANPLQNIVGQSVKIEVDEGVEGDVPKEGLEQTEDAKKGFPMLVFIMGVFARLRNGFERILYSNWFSRWPFWWQEKLLDRLIVEADANPKDAAKQSARALLAELNKHRCTQY